MNYYKDYFLRYIAAEPHIRKASKKHWLTCHAKNVASGRKDLIIFSAKMLGSIALADDMLEKLGMN